MADLSPVPAVTRDQVRQVIVRELLAKGDGGLTAAADAVMALLAEAPQPKVLYEGPSLPIPVAGTDGMVMDHWSRCGDLFCPPGTPVAVVALGPPVLEAPEEEQPDHGFMWIGQPFTSCDECGRPAWEHPGMHRPDREDPFNPNSDGVIVPWKPGEADAIRRKWVPEAPEGGSDA